MKKRELWSLSSLFLFGVDNKAKIEELEGHIFIKYLNEVLNYNIDMATEQSLIFALGAKLDLSKIDYQKLADFVGYEMPQK